MTASSARTDHHLLFDCHVIERTVAKLAAEIDRDHAGQEILAIVVLKGAAFFAVDLLRAMATETTMAFVSASSYIDGFRPGASITVRGLEALPIEDRCVLIIEDIVDTGRTLARLETEVRALAPREVSTVALVNKTGRRSHEFAATYSGLEISDELIYGYGLDWDERYRALPFIASVDPAPTES